MDVDTDGAEMAEGQHQYDALKHEVERLGFVRPGSVVRRFMPCGKPGCRCMADPPQLHGPYYEWSYKVRGKTVTKRLSEAQARLCQEWQQNHRQLRMLVRRMERVSLRETDRLLHALVPPTRKARTSKKKNRVS
jgi:hypothetical protein